MHKRPPMKQEGHPAHNMPKATKHYDGDHLPINAADVAPPAAVARGADFDNDDY